MRKTPLRVAYPSDHAADRVEHLTLVREVGADSRRRLLRDDRESCLRRPFRVPPQQRDGDQPDDCDEQAGSCDQDDQVPCQRVSTRALDHSAISQSGKVSRYPYGPTRGFFTRLSTTARRSGVQMKTTGGSS